MDRKFHPSDFHMLLSTSYFPPHAEASKSESFSFFAEKYRCRSGGTHAFVHATENKKTRCLSPAQQRKTEHQNQR
jgi:hypothetical protein